MSTRQASVVALLLFLFGIACWLYADGWLWRSEVESSDLTIRSSQSPPGLKGAQHVTASANPSDQEESDQEDRNAGDESLREAVALQPFVIVGRCVAGEDRKRGLAGASVAVVDVAWNKDPRGKPSPQQASGHAVTGAGGRFRISLDRIPDLELFVQRWVVIRAPGRVVWGKSRQKLRRGTPVDLGEIPLVRGARVTGRVADLPGKPVKTELLLYRRPGSGKRPGSRYSRFHVHTDAAGRFVGGSIIGVGNYSIQSMLGLVVDRPKSFDVKPGQATAHLEVVVATLDPSEAIRGRVRDMAGKGLSELQVNGFLIGGHESYRRVAIAMAKTREDGSFQLLRHAHFDNLDKETHGAIRLVVHGGKANVSKAIDKVRWGQTELQVALDARDLTLVLATVRPVIAGTRDSIGAFSYRRYVTAGHFQSNGKVWKVKAGEPIELRGVDPGTHVLAIQPADKALAQQTFVAVEVPQPAGSEQLVEIAKLAVFQVRLVAPGGAKIRGSKIELRRHNDRKLLPSGPFRQTIAYARTNVEGVAELRGPLKLAGLELVAIGPGHLPVTRPVRIDAAGQVTDVPVQLGVKVRGRLDPVEVWRGFKGARSSGPRASGSQRQGDFVPARSRQAVSRAQGPGQHRGGGGRHVRNRWCAARPVSLPDQFQIRCRCAARGTSGSGVHGRHIGCHRHRRSRVTSSR